MVFVIRWSFRNKTEMFHTLVCFILFCFHICNKTKSGWGGVGVLSEEKWDVAVRDWKRIESCDMVLWFVTWSCCSSNTVLLLFIQTNWILQRLQLVRCWNNNYSWIPNVISFVCKSLRKAKKQNASQDFHFKCISGHFLMQTCLSSQEFIQLYQILLPRGLLSSQGDVKVFLMSMNLNADNFQIGKNKVSQIFLVI